MLPQKHQMVYYKLILCRVMENVSMIVKDRLPMFRATVLTFHLWCVAGSCSSKSRNSQKYQVPVHTLKEITAILVQSLVDKGRRATSRHDSAAGADLSNWDHTEQKFAFPHLLSF